jgi:calcineurin-like phosphoesterase family protein
MTDKMVENINKTVGQDDILHYLGDWSFGGIESIWNLRKRIICKNIHFIYGNHDHHIENNAILPNVHRAEPYSSTFVDGKGIHTRDSEYPDYVEAQSLFKSVNYYKELSLNKQRIVLSHFAFRVWNKSHHGAWHLYGHSHNTLDNINGRANPYGKSMDVGIDAHPEFRPFHLEEIRKIMEKRSVLFVDHHSKQTN